VAETPLHEAKPDLPTEPKPRRVIGRDDGLFEVPEDFDAPLPDEVLALFDA